MGMKLARRATVAFSTVGLLACACASSGQSSGSRSSTFTFQTPNPVTVTEQLDQTRTVSANVDSSNGGKLSVTDADGVRFTLTVPPKALLVDQTMSLTPVVALGGLPFHGGLVAAVHIEPDGLSLLQPAVLTIEGAKAVSAGFFQVGFSYRGTGNDLHLYPINTDKAIEFKLFHFSTPGVAASSQQDLTSQLQHPPTNALAQVEQRLEELVRAAKEGRVSQSEFYSGVKDVLDAFESERVAPEVDAATKSGASWDQVQQAFTDLDRWGQIAEEFQLNDAAHESRFKKRLTKLRAALEPLFKNQVEACFKHDVRAGLRAASLIRQFLFYGWGELPIDPLERCLTFKLDFEIQLHVVVNPAATYDLHLIAKGAPLSLREPQGTGGSAPLIYVSLEVRFPQVPVPPCTVTSSGKVLEDFKAVHIEGLGLDYQHGVPSEITDFSVDLTPGKTTEEAGVTCPNAPINLATSNSIYNDNWEHLHMDEHYTHTCSEAGKLAGCVDADYYKISGWTMTSGGRLFARRIYQRTMHPLDLSVDETTVFNLWHEPQGTATSA